MCVSCFAFFLADTRLVTEVKSLPFSEVKLIHLDGDVLRQSIILKGDVYSS